MIGPGTSLAHYEIVSALGKGGMGEVYRARDNKLGREVAIKVLPPEFSHDEERLARLEREARMLAALNHPNIAAIHGLEESDDIRFLVLELVEGDTLADRLKRGAIPVEQSLKLALQIAEALEAAHEKSVVHRDLKPANIKVTPDGRVKVLDFGLAKAFVGSQDDVSLSHSPTLSMAATQAGVILGTAAYMSPEQAKGLPADHRSDLFSFGCVLYEMLTGRTAFRGELVTEVMASVINQEPDYSSLPTNLHPGLEQLLRRCFAKDAKSRWQAAGDLRLELAAAMAHPFADPEAGAHAVASGARLPWVVAVVAALVVGAGVWILKPTAPPVGLPGVVRLSLPLDAESVINRSQADFDVSPDGARITYVDRGELYLRALSETDATRLTGTLGASAPFFAPGGDWVGFFADGQLRRIPTAGGVSEPVTDLGYPGGGAFWSQDDFIYFTPNNTDAIWRVPAFGGEAEPVTEVDREGGEVSHRWPRVLPGGSGLLFTVWTGPGLAEKRIDVQVLGTGERRTIAPGGNTARYLLTGHLVYGLPGDQTLMALPFDLGSLQANGPAVRLDDPVGAGGEGMVYAVSESGTMIHVVAGPPVESRLAWIDQNGDVETIGPVGAYHGARISPDGRFAAVSTIGPASGVAIFDFARSVFTPIQGDQSNQFAVWHPNGSDILFRGTRRGFRNVYRMAANGGGAELQVTSGENLQTPQDVSADGWLLYAEGSPDTGDDLWVVRLDTDDAEPRAFLATPAAEFNARMSPDGRSVAYQSDTSGQPEVFVRPFPEGEPRTLVGPGQRPVWSRDGTQLFHLSVDGTQMMVADIGGSGPELTVGSPRALVTSWPGIIAASHTYDVASDGRFLTSVLTDPNVPPTEVRLVLNWLEELKERVAVP